MKASVTKAVRFPRQQPKDPQRARLRARIVKFNRAQEKALARLLLDFNREVRRRLPMGKLADALAIAAADEAFQLLDVEPVIEAVEPDVLKILQASMEFGGEQTAARIRAQLPMRKAITLGFRFDLVNPHALAFAKAHAGDLIREFGVRANRELIREVLRRGFEEGLTRFQMAKQLRDRIGLTHRMVRQVSRFRQVLEREGRFTRKQLERKASRLAAQLEARRALTIARTEVVRASAQGQIESLAQARRQGIVGGDSEVEWVVLRDGKADEDCAVLDGERVKQGELFSAGVEGPPLHPNCLPGDSLVLAEGVAAVSERRYQGEVVVVTTANAHRLVCTPNHPCLTPSGWKAAQALHVGGYVIGVDRMIGVDQDVEHVPSRIEEVAEAFRLSPGVVAREVPVAAPHFHGDGVGSEVAVVWTHGNLGDGGDPSTAKRVSQESLGRGHAPEFLKRLRSHALRLVAHLATAACVVRRSHLRPALLVGHPLPLEAFGGGPTASDDPAPLQEATDGAAADPVPDAQRVHRLAGPVTLDEIVSIERRQFDGHVFNLQAADGFFVADGIVTHNCRCMLNIHAKPPASFKSREQRQTTDGRIDAQAETRARVQRLRLDALRASLRQSEPGRPTHPGARQ